jgi:ABC-type transport system involved in multi-copper enzyme maturation permease subunit
VFVYELIRSGRRGELIGHRCLYACVLLFVLLCAYWSWFPWLTPAQFFTEVPLGRAQRAAFASYFSASFLAVQLTVVVLLIPLYTAGAIAEQKERRTLEFVLVTDLTDWEIVLGMLGARLLRMYLLILTGLPFLGALDLLGGIDPDLVLAGFALTVVLAASLGGISTLISVESANSTRAVALAYATTLLLCLPSVAAGEYLAVALPSRTAQLGAVLTICAFLALVTLGSARIAVSALRESVGAADGVRVVRQPAEGLSPLPPRAHEQVPGDGWGPFPEWDLPRRAGEYSRSAPRPIGQRPTVGADALLWKEVHLESTPARSALPPPAIVATLALVVTCGPALGWLGDLPSGGVSFAEYAQSWTRGVGITVSGLLTLLIALNAAGRISREREQGTLEGLLLLPVSDAEIVFAKWLGSILSVRSLLGGLVVVWCAAVLTGGLAIVALPSLVAALAVYAGFFAALGLWFSALSTSTLRAGLFTLLVTLLVVAGPSALASLASGGTRFLPLPGDRVEWTTLFLEYGLSPPATFWTLSFRSDDLIGSPDASVPFARLLAAFAGLHCYLAGALLFWNLARGRLRRRLWAHRGLGRAA